jgi:hypothetical protein
MFDLLCTDPNHNSRELHANANVRALWYDESLGTTSVEREAGKYKEVCGGCALANVLDNVFPAPSDKYDELEARVAALESK